MPERANVHVDVALSTLAIEYKNLPFVAPKIFPVIPVPKEKDKYWTFLDRPELKDDLDVLRADGAEASEFDYEPASATFSCEEYAKKMLLTDRKMALQDKAVSLEIRTVGKLLTIIGLAYEKRIQKIVQDRTYVTRGATPTIKWDGSSPTIEANVDTAKQSIEDNAGVQGNAIVMNTLVRDVIKKDSVIRNLIRYTVQTDGGKNLLVDGNLPPVIWGLEVIIAGAQEDTAEQGQTSVFSRIWNDNVLVFYKEERPSLDALSLGYTMRVKQRGPLTTLVSKWRVEKRKGTMIEVSQLQDEKLTAEKAGYIITDTLT
ncbi:hypothetical protein ES707_12304 [subsurface metagenome]